MKSRPYSKRVLGTFGIEFAGGLARVATPIVMARALGADEYGLYMAAMTVLLLAFSLGCGGFAQAAGYFAARFGNRATARRLVLVALGLGIATAAVAMPLTLGYRAAAVPSIRRETMLLVTLLVIPHTLETTALSMLRGQKRTEWAAFVAFARQLSLLAAGVLLLVTVADHSIAILLTGMVSLTVAMAAGSSAARGPSSEKLERPRARDVARYSVHVHASQLLTYLNYRLDLFIVTLIASPADVGIYALVVALAESVWFASYVIASILVGEVAGTDDRELAWQKTARASRLSFLGSFSFAAVAGALSPVIMMVVTGGSSEHWLVLLVSLLAASVLVPSRILATHRAASGAPQKNLPASALGVVVNAVLTLLLVGLLGILGAALATLVSYALICVDRIVGFARACPRGHHFSVRDVLIPDRGDLRAAWQGVRQFRASE